MNPHLNPYTIPLFQESREDEIPDSGVRISKDRMKELMALSGVEAPEGESEDEMTESISELPSFAKNLRPVKKMPQVGKPEVKYHCFTHKNFGS